VSGVLVKSTVVDALHVKCPHCGNGIQHVEPAPAEVTCGGCGSSFDLDLQATSSNNKHVVISFGEPRRKPSAETSV
jgi:uncharacterized protein (DUF983 family)